MPLRYLRPGLPTSSTLTVSQRPCVAKLDQNESPFELPAELKEDLLAELGASPWHRYPQPAEYAAARGGLAEAWGLEPETVVLTAGCDQAIQGAHFLAGGPGRRALVFEPTYPMLAHAGLMAGTDVTRVDLGPGYDLGVEHLAIEAELILVASPNNPTGTCLPEAVLDAALERSALVFIDEAYFDFSGVTLVPRLAEHPNLVIGRSCSKSLLAGMRLGYTVSRPEVATRLEQLLSAPYHLSHAQLLLARRFAEVRPHVEAAAAQVVAERQRLDRALRDLGLDPAPSQTNFLLLALDHAAEVYDGLARRGIRVRYAPKIPGLEGYIRVTVGSPEQNDIFVKTLAELVAAPSAVISAGSRPKGSR